MEGSPSDLVVEWGSPEAETGLEEPMWQLALGGGAEAYPERPDEANCMYYLRTGFCGYGARCRYNHPRDRGAVVGAMRAAGGEFPERVGQPICQVHLLHIVFKHKMILFVDEMLQECLGAENEFYMKTGLCKYGASCKYDHPRQGGGSAAPMALNICGYPLRLGEKECSYYVKTGRCKFGPSCKFHHPQPAGMQLPLPTPGPFPVLAPVHPPAFYPPAQSPSAPSSQQYGAVAGNWPIGSPALVPGSNVQGPYSPMLLPPGMIPFSGWNPYHAAVSPVASPSTQSAAGVPQVYGITQLSPSAPAYTGAYASLPSSAGPSSSSQKEQKFPERPGQPECQYYMKTGDCKYGSTCKYHHPPAWSTPSTNFALSPMGLPLRPGAPLCMHYAQNGVCKFGPSCKFDHPMGTLSYSPSASSLADMPVAPYPVGTSMGTLAPSSSSSELRPELISGSNKDAFSSMKSSSMSTSSGGPASHLSVQQSGQVSALSTASSSTSHGGETRTSS